MFESLTRIYAQLYKSVKTLRRNYWRLSDLLLWPLVSLFTLTFFVSYLGTNSNYINMIILGLMGWRMIYFPNVEMVSAFVDEHYSKSLPHLLISPSSRLEYSVGAAISGVIKGAFVIVFYLVLTHFIYGFSIPNLTTFFIAIIFMALIGFANGFMTLGLAYRWKNEAFLLGFLWPDFIVLLSGVYFSVSAVYPAWIVPIINLLPTTQGFDLLKSMVGLGTPNIPLLALLTGIWLVFAYLFNGWMYEKARKSGKLTKLG